MMFSHVLLFLRAGKFSLQKPVFVGEAGAARSKKGIAAKACVTRVTSCEDILE
jgi:hypothetical protein